MPYPATPAEQEAIGKLASGYFNNGPQTSANPGGFDNGGYITNLHETTSRVALAASFVGDAAEFVDGRAEDAAQSAADAALYRGNMSGSSTTSVEIGEGLKTFATQAGKFFEPGVT
jgi:hypothetical protein